MGHWLLKTEPDLYSIDDLRSEGTAHWDGVRSPMACANLRAMKVGDEAFFYHSSCEVPGVVGLCRVVREAYPDHTSWDAASRYYDERSTPEKPRWWMPDVEFVAKFEQVVPLATLRKTKGLDNMTLLRNSRLSVSAVSPKEWKIVMGLAT